MATTTQHMPTTTSTERTDKRHALPWALLAALIAASRTHRGCRHLATHGHHQHGGPRLAGPQGRRRPMGRLPTRWIHLRTAGPQGRRRPLGRLPTRWFHLRTAGPQGSALTAAPSGPPLSTYREEAAHTLDRRRGRRSRCHMRRPRGAWCAGERGRRARGHAELRIRGPRGSLVRRHGRMSTETPLRRLETPAYPEGSIRAQPHLWARSTPKVASRSSCSWSHTT